MPLPPNGTDFAPWAPGRVTRTGNKITGTLMLVRDFGLVLEQAEIVFDGQGLTVIFRVTDADEQD